MREALTDRRTPPIGPPPYRYRLWQPRGEIMICIPCVFLQGGVCVYVCVCVHVMHSFKLPSLETLCEDYGQVAWYKGTIPVRACSHP